MNTVPSSYGNHKEALGLRPNTALPTEFFQDDMIICTGEDAFELECAMRTSLAVEIPVPHQYRCYRAWKYDGLTVILSGIGTGCLEPLMFEILDDQTLGDLVPKRLVLIGTAGYLADSGFGQVYLVDGAYPVGSAVSIADKFLPLRPRYPGLENIAIKRAKEVSSDYYYAHTPQTNDRRKNMAKTLNPAMAEAIAKFWKPGMLISMESAQFYHFASIYGLPFLRFVALRGVANLADKFDTQGDFSQAVLIDTFKQALVILNN